MQRKPKKQILFGQDARTELLTGANIASATIAKTLGPRGGTVILDKGNNQQLVTSDGVSVAREITLYNKMHNMGAEMIKSACARVEEEAGDGTTTTAMLTNTILKKGAKYIAAGGVDPISIQRGINKAVSFCVDLIQDWGKPVHTEKEITQVAMVATNGDEDISKALAKSCMIAGATGSITVEDGVSMDVEVIIKEGIELDAGWASPYFCDAEDKSEIMLESPLVAVVKGKVNSIDDVRAILEEGSQWPNPKLIFSLHTEGEALRTMIINHKKGVVKCCAVNVPGMHRWKEEWLEDIAALSGATLIDPDKSMKTKDFQPEYFGSLQKVIVKNKTTTIEAFEEAHDGLMERLKQLNHKMLSSTSDYDRDKYQERIAQLEGGLVILRVGGVSEMAMKERRARIEDALGAIRGALEEGVLPGAGNTLLLLSQALKAEEAVAFDGDDDYSELVGWRLLADALPQPFYHISESCGVNGQVAEDRIANALDEHFTLFTGWDPIQQKVRNLCDEPGILNSARTVRTAIQTAASIAGTLLTCEAAISIKR